MKQYIIDLYGLENGALAPDNHKKGLKHALDKLEKEFTQWKSLKEEKPICFESGEWDGLKSEPFLCKAKGTEKVFVAVAYEGILDGSAFFDIYNNSDSLIVGVDKLEWRSLII